MKGVIQAGGLGTRLHPVTLEIPKQLLTVKRKPIIQYLVELFRKHGIDEIFVVANVNDMELFEKWKNDYENDDVTLVIEHDRLGTWGGMQKYMREHLHETFVVSNGDELKDTDITAMVQFHKQNGALATIASVRVEDAKDYGVLVSDEAGKVAQFLYKPVNPPSNFIMSGIYVAEPALFDLHFESDIISFEENVLPHVIEQGKLYEFKTNGRWYDCGTFERYEKAIKEW